MLVRMKETEIQRAIIDGLRWRGILAFRCQPAPVPIRNGRSIVGFRKADQFNIGMPDIVCVIEGRFIGIEVKSETGRQSAEQIEWQAKIKKAGGTYVLAHSWEDVEKAILCNTKA